MFLIQCSYVLETQKEKVVPVSGELVNPDTGEKAEMDYAIEDNESDDNNNDTQAGDENPDNAQ